MIVLTILSLCCAWATTAHVWHDELDEAVLGCILTIVFAASTQLL